MKAQTDWLTLVEKAAADWKEQNGEEMPDDQRQLLLQVARESMELQAQKLQDSPPPTRAGFTTLSGVTEQTETAKSAKVLTFPKKRQLTVEQQVAELNAPCANCDGECQKTGSNRFWLVTDINDVGTWQVKRCPVGIQRDMARKFRSAKIPNRYLNKTFDDYKIDEFNRDAVTFAKNFGRFNFGAYFFGECGTGKTFLAALTAQEFLKNGKSVIFIKVPSLLDDIKATFNGNGRELDLLDKLQAANLVVLDDFGMEKSTQWAGATLCKVLDMRYDNPTARTIVTSNLSIEELAKHLNNASDGQNLNGSRIADRLREICKPILLKGTTRRN